MATEWETTLRELATESRISGKMVAAEQSGEITWTGLQDGFSAIGLAFEETDAKYIAACVNFVQSYLREG